MPLPDLVRHDNPFVIPLLFVDVIQNNILVSRPSTPANNRPSIITESLDFFNPFRRISNLLNPIKTCIPGLLHVSDSYG